LLLLAVLLLEGTPEAGLLLLPLLLAPASAPPLPRVFLLKEEEVLRWPDGTAPDKLAWAS
jgi:hypothetical protein